MATLTASQEAELLQHLRDEHAALDQLLRAVREVRQALINQDAEQLTQALETEADCLDLGEAMRSRRGERRMAWAVHCGVPPEEVTLSRLEAIVSESARGEVAQHRRRLAEKLSELARWNQQNAAMLRQSLELGQQILGQLTGTAPEFASYNAAGQTEPAHVGSVMQWGG